MIDSQIGAHAQKFSEVVERVLDSGRSLLGSGEVDTTLAAIAFDRNELSRLRNELALPTRDFLNCKVVEHDYQAFVRYVADHVISRGGHFIDVNEFGRIAVVFQHEETRVSLSGIELLTELRDLTLQSVEVADCSSLSELPYLARLSMTGNFKLDVSTLGVMNALEHLNCSNSLVGDLLWISKCPNIKFLSAESCNLYSLEGLSGCRSLEELDIARNPLQSLSSIEGHLHIKELRIVETPIRDFSPLTSLPSLRELQVSADMTSRPSFDNCLRYLHKKGVTVKRLNADSSMDYI